MCSQLGPCVDEDEGEGVHPCCVGSEIGFGSVKSVRFDCFDHEPEDPLVAWTPGIPRHDLFKAPCEDSLKELPFAIARGRSLAWSLDIKERNFGMRSNRRNHPPVLLHGADNVYLLGQSCTWSERGLRTQTERDDFPVGELPIVSYEEIAEVRHNSSPSSLVEYKVELDVAVGEEGAHAPWIWTGEDEMECANAKDDTTIHVFAAGGEQVPDHRMVTRWIIDSGCGHDLVSRFVVGPYPHVITKAETSITNIQHRERFGP